MKKRNIYALLWWAKNTALALCLVATFVIASIAVNAL